MDVKTANKKFSVYRKIEQSPNVSIHGQVFTKQHIVDLILDLVGYGSTARISRMTLLDPGCGTGAFVSAAAKRLIDSQTRAFKFDEISDCLLGIEKDAGLVERCRARIVTLLTNKGYGRQISKRLAKRWIKQADFLDCDTKRSFDFVVGNPPYVRQEAIPKDSLEQYRNQFNCFYDRADLYVAFLEKGLGLLSETGQLGFICPNRFTRNRYGSKIRDLISRHHKVRCVIDLPNASPFEPPVMSYPGIYVIARGRTTEVDHVRLDSATEKECCETRAILLDGKRTHPSKGIFHYKYKQWFDGQQQWSMESPAHLKLLRRLESECTPLGSPASGCRVGIGVATGADRVFIVSDDVDVEPEVLFPIATTSDIKTGKVKWSNRYVINPFRRDDSGALIDLNDFPRTKAYLEHFKDRLCRRNVAKRNSTRWYRTIDRIYPRLLRQQKLLIPDIKANNIVVYESGKLYPHHNLYFVTSEYWNLRALQTILRSSLAKFFVWMYGVRMRSDFLRFQAQYLRRICLPDLNGVSKPIVAELVNASDHSVDEIDELVSRLYGLSKRESELVRKLSDN